MNAKKEKSTKRSLAIVAVLLVLLMAIGGTVAWLTSTSTLENTFTVGLIKPIDPNIPNSGPGDKNIDASKLSGNLYEPNWTQDSKLMPGVTIAKDPYVGVGAGSEESYVYVYVDNSMANNDHVYFTINRGWEPVAGQVSEVASGTADKKYTGGLFRYTAGLKGSGQGNTWTTQPLFSNVIVDEAAKLDDFIVKGSTTPKLDGTDEIGTMTVKSLIHQKMDGDQVIPESVAQEAAVQELVNQK